jgi:D-2-hydroxyacid dehydrogenase (NADP+)
VERGKKLKTIAVWLTIRGINSLTFDSGNEARLARAFPDARLVICRHQAELLAALETADAALVWRFDQDWFTLAPKLRFVSTPAAGHEYCDVVPPEGVRVHYGSFHGLFMAETVVGMILAACRGILMTAWLQKSASWPRQELDRAARPLRGSHVVIVGFGTIGGMIGRQLKSFGVQLTGVKRSPAPSPDYFDAGDRIVLLNEFDQVLPVADHLVLCLPGGKDSDRILDRRRLALLPNQAWVYNVGRGNAIDEEALAQALKEGVISGACLDVYEQEPLPDGSPLRSAPNLLLMPHGSAFSPTYMDRYLDEVIPLLKHALGGNDSA